jgi:hypothetical protein
MSRVAVYLLAGAFVVATDASAQPVGSHEWSQGTTLAGFMGAASAESDTDAAAGLTFGWEILPRFTVEGSGIWVASGPDADAFAGLFGARIGLLPPHPVVPFVSGAAGIYHMAFDRAPNMVPAMYRGRMNAEIGRRSFDDFVVAFGGGADIFLMRHLSLRPELRVLWLQRDSLNHTITTLGVSLAYHFEEHPVTPTR